MLFRRRHKPTRLEQLRVAVWPRHSWVRSTRYYSKRVLRLTATPHAIAIGFAAGAFASFTPMIGFHFIISFALAYVIGGNLIAAALGTSVGNPITFPFIWGATYKLGSWILRGESPDHPPQKFHEQLDPHQILHSFDKVIPLLKPMFVGAVPLGLTCGVISYLVVYKSVEVYQTQRKRVLASKRLAPGAGEDDV